MKWFVENMLKSRSFWGWLAVSLVETLVFVFAIPKDVGSLVAWGGLMTANLTAWLASNKVGDNIQARKDIATGEGK